MMVPPREMVYQPAPLEQYLVDNAIALGFDRNGDTPDEMASGCEIWNNEENPMYNTTQTFRRELKNYYAKIASFRSLPDLRTLFLQDESNRDEVCKRAELDPVHGLLEGFFNESKQLSYSSSGYMEPLFPPMRHPDFCDQETVLSLAYLVHDFGVMCRRLKKTSRIVLFDLGASLEFHGDDDPMDTPAMYLVTLYRKFGFRFDHIYAFEITPHDSEEVFDKIPHHNLAAYHWINVGVSSDISSRNNPWNLLMTNYNEDDLIIIKLDVDNGSIEVPLTHQLLNDTRFHRLVDQFYFEHHVKMSDIAYAWNGTMVGSVQESMELFQGLRKKGIPSHFWV
ncbi:hypothetical protein MHU86_6752 [Fragilaria crotonensis]|nr:hypothetical protein MHU86_6752 [Fragilaria crotonensis]